MDDCLPGSEEFERRKNMMRLMGMEYMQWEYTHLITHEGIVYARSVYTEDIAWERAWDRYQRLNRST